MATYPRRGLLEHPISEAFGLPDPLPGRLRTALAQVADQAQAAGMDDLWMLGPGRGGVWLSTWRYPCPGVELDLELRPVPLPGWDGIWDIRIDLAVECECQTDHNAHYVRAYEAQCSTSALATSVHELLSVADGWTTSIRDASWWRQQAGLS